ncbi:hypothetical protein C8J56DRAFT_949032 [Mycena floridula]|nr:hypothetical protein C8J56DRAFT_949032 [Mycena floridula]
MSHPPVILDDQDSRIAYAGRWSLAGSEVNYSRTLYSSAVPGATMTFTFTGTSLTIVGDFDVGGSCTATFSIDGASATYKSPVLSQHQHQQVIWSSTSLSDGEHTFVYTLTSCEASGGSGSGFYLWIDYLLYTPSVTVQPDGVKYFIDDGAPQLQYSGKWNTTGEDGDFGGTKHGGISGTSMQLAFTGTYVSVNGRVNNGTNGAITKGSFSVDGATPVTFSAPAQDSISYNKELFSIHTLSPGNHTLLVTPQSDTPLWIDYLLVEPDPVASATPSPVADKNATSIPMVVGIAVGVGALIAAGLLVFWYFKRRGRPTGFSVKSKPVKGNDNVSTAWSNYSQLPIHSRPSTPGSTALLITAHDYNIHNYPPSPPPHSQYSSSIISSPPPSHALSHAHSSRFGVDPALSASGRSVTRQRSATTTNSDDHSLSRRDVYRALPSDIVSMTSSQSMHHRTQSDGRSDGGHSRRQVNRPNIVDAPIDILDEAADIVSPPARSHAPSSRSRARSRSRSRDQLSTTSRNREEPLRDVKHRPSVADALSEVGSSTSSGAVHVDSGFRLEDIPDDKYPSEPPPQYTAN